MIPRILTLAAIASLASIPSLAEPLVLPNKSFSGCPTPANRTAMVDDIIGKIDALTSHIERVPASEAEYLKSETEAAIEQQNAARYNVAASNRFFTPWEVWNVHRTATASLKAVMDSDDPRVTIVGAARALGDLPSLYETLDQYLVFDRKRVPRAYDETSLHFYKAGLTASLSYLVECAAMSIERD